MHKEYIKYNNSYPPFHKTKKKQGKFGNKRGHRLMRRIGKWFHTTGCIVFEEALRDLREQVNLFLDILLVPVVSSLRKDV